MNRKVLLITESISEYIEVILDFITTINTITFTTTTNTITTNTKSH